MTHQQQGPPSSSSSPLEPDTFRQVVEQFPGVIVIYGPDLRIRFINAHGVRRGGHPREMYIGRTDTELFPPETTDSYMPALHRAAETGQPQRVEIDIVLGGEQRYGIAHYIPLLDEAGEIQHIVGTSYDVTARKKAQQALQESEARYRAIIESQIDLVCMYTLEGVLIYVNDAYCTFFGRPREELIGRDFFFLSPEFQHEPIRQRLQTVRHDPSPSVAEYLSVTPEGQKRWIQWVDHGIVNEQGEVELVQAVGRDITRLKEAEARMDEYIRRLQALQHIDRTIIEARPAAETAAVVLERLAQALRYACAEVTAYDATSRTWNRLAAAGPHDPPTLPYDRISQKMDAFRAQHSHLVPDLAALVDPTPDEQALLAAGFRSYDAFPLVFGSELVGLILVMYRDPYTPAGEELSAAHELADHLAIAIKQARLDQQMLRYATELENKVVELEAKNAEMERFTYTVSHDLKSPLITIRGFLGLLEDDIRSGDEERVAYDIQLMQNAAVRMQDLLDDLLELSRVGRLVNPPQPVPLVELAQEAVDLLHGILEARGVQVIIDPNLPVVYGDRPRLLEVVQNLIENATKFMGEQPKPSVRIELREQIDGEAVIAVADNGIGIEPRFHEKIFGLFEQLDRGPGGTGIGLALVKRIVEIHGGRIWVESQGEGQGSTFVFMLPLYREHTAPE